MASLPDADFVAGNGVPASPKGRFSSQSRWLWGAAGVGLGMAIALVGGSFFSGDRASEETAAPAEGGAAQAVTVAPVQMGTIVEGLSVNGTVEAGDLLQVPPQVPGLQVRQVLVQAGEAVAAGQALVILDDADLSAQLRQAQSQLDVARAQVQQQRAALAQAEAGQREAQSALGRFQALAAEGAISPLELDNRSTQAVTAMEGVRVARAGLASAEAAVRSREADVARLQTQLSYTVLRAPAAGVVAEPPVSVGAVSALGTPMVSLIRDNQLQLVATVPQAQLNQVVVGAPVVIRSATDSSLALTGAVQAIRPLVDAATRTAEVVISLPGSDRLRVGMFLTGEIQVGSRQGLTVPAAALLPQGDGSVQVMVVGSDGRATLRRIEIGTRRVGTLGSESPVEVLTGLTPGEQVIVAGASYVQDGDRVTVVEDF